MKNGVLKKICAVSLAACMITGVGYVCAGSITDAGITASASVEVHTDDYFFETEVCHYDYMRILRYTGKDKEVVVPTEYEGKEVFYIENGAFGNNKNLVSVTLPNTITYIGEYAFASDPSLAYVIVPDSVTYIGENIFNGSKNAKMYVCKGSYAETYAKKHKIPYAYMNFPLKSKAYVSHEEYELNVGDTIYVSCYAYGGTKDNNTDYQYAVYYKRADSTKWTAAQDFSKENEVTIKPKHSGAYNICVKVKDKAGKVAKTYYKREVYPKFKNKSELSASEIKLGQKVYVERRFSGGIGTADFEVFYKNENQTKWTKATNYENGDIVIKPRHKGTYTVVVRGTYYPYREHDDFMSAVHSKKTLMLNVN